MHIMLVNDDGIHAAGIRELCRTASAAGHRVSICAPDRERSAASHAITLSAPLTAVRTDVEGAEMAYAVNGTPADCARLGLFLIPGVDAVISGINNGANLGGACVYSGTVGAAMEASMSGCPALAASLCKVNSPDYSAAAKLAVRTAEWMMNRPLPRGAVYNLNVPAIPETEIRGICAATLAPTYLDSAVYAVEETSEGVQYRYAPGENVPMEDPEYDALRVEEGYATLTKVTWDIRLNAPDPDVSELNGKGVGNTGKEKHYEIERKYLIAMPAPEFLKEQPGCVVWDIVQTYLLAPEGETRRVRLVKEKGEERMYKTFKRRVSALSSMEDEGLISREEYEGWLKDADPELNPIVKTRYRIPFEGQLLEFDLYPFWTDRAVLEIEMESEAEATHIPEWVSVIREVTEDYRYRNVKLARSVPMDEI